MPPKKKKGGKKSAKKRSATEKNAKPGFSMADVFNEVSKEFYLVQICDLEQKISRYQEKCDVLELQNKEVQDKFDQQAADKKEIVSFLKKQLELKCDEIGDLQSKVNILEESGNIAKEKCELEVATLKTQMIAMKDQLTSENMVLGGKLASLEEFRAQRENLMNKFAEMEELLKTQEIKHKEQIYQLERKAVVDKDRLKKEMILRVNTVAAEFRKVSNKQMADTTKRAIRENVMINSQLGKMSDKTMELISENDEVKDRAKMQRQHIEILEDNEKELMKKNAMYKKLVMMLTDKSREQEQCLEEFVKREVKFNSLEKEFEALKRSMEDQERAECLLKEELKCCVENSEKLAIAKKDLNEDKHYLISILADASHVIKQALQHHDTSDPATMEMRNVNLLQKVVEILNLAAEMGVGINPLELASARKSHKLKKSVCQISQSAPAHASLLLKKPEAHYNLGDLGLVPASNPKLQMKSSGKTKKSISKSTVYTTGSLSTRTSHQDKEMLKLPFLQPSN